MGHKRATTRENRPPLKLRDREAVDATDAGRLLDVSLSTILGWNREELMPAPIRLGGVVRYRVRELQDWLAAGCPPRDEWKWKPTVAVNLATFIDALGTEAVELGRLIEHLKQRAAAGEVSAHIRSK